MGMKDLSNLPDPIDAIKPSVIQIKTPQGQVLFANKTAVDAFILSNTLIPMKNTAANAWHAVSSITRASSTLKNAGLKFCKK